MNHDVRLAREITSRRLGPGGALALAAAAALCDTGTETVELSRKLVDRTRTSVASAANQPDAGRTAFAYWDGACRDWEAHADRVSRIWRRYLREAAELTVALYGTPLA
jgi:hypothetical protein